MGPQVVYGSAFTESERDRVFDFFRRAGSPVIPAPMESLHIVRERIKVALVDGNIVGAVYAVAPTQDMAEMVRSGEGRLALQVNKYVQVLIRASVQSDMRRYGIGRELLGRLEADLRLTTSNAVVVCAVPRSAIGFFSAVGFDVQPWGADSALLLPNGIAYKPQAEAGYHLASLRLNQRAEGHANRTGKHAK